MDNSPLLTYMNEKEEVISYPWINDCFFDRPEMVHMNEQ